MSTIFSFLSEHHVLALFLLVGLGMLVGHGKIRGVSLGPAAVLFVSIAIACWGQIYGVSLTIHPQLGLLGLSLFAFAIGVSSGASFFRNLRAAVGPIITMVIILATALSAGMIVGRAMHLPQPTILGAFAGAVTNTPALATAGEATGDLSAATIAYSITYIFGVICLLAAAAAALSYGKQDQDAPVPLATQTIRIQRQDHPSISELREQLGEKVMFSRLRREESGPTTTPVETDIIYPDDLITIVTQSDCLNDIAQELGVVSSRGLNDDRRDIDFQHVIASNHQIPGRTIEELDIPGRFHGTISRVRRGDTDIIAVPHLLLCEGDQVGVVAPRSQFKDIRKFFGNSTRGLTDLNPVILGLGMALGLLIGEIQVKLPGGGHVALGSAAGALIVGLILGKVGRVGPIITTMPHTTCQLLSELGILIFLAQAGTNAGGQILGAFSSGAWWRILFVGMIMTVIVAVGVYSSMRWVHRMGGTRLSGVLAGTQTQPAVLAFANDRTDADSRVALGYALVYPVAMIVKILLVQLFSML